LSGVLLPEDSELTKAAARALGAFGPAAAPALPKLTQTLKEAIAQKQPSAAIAMAGALGRLDPKTATAGEAIAFLVEAVRSQRSDLRQDAIVALGNYGPAAAAVIPGLIAVLGRASIQDGRYQERGPAATALGLIAPGTAQADESIAALTDSLELDVYRPGTREVVEALARFGPMAARAIPRLRDLEKVTVMGVGDAARRALDALKPSQ
jgi:hypothetical protein